MGISLFTALTVQEDLRSGRLIRVLPAWHAGQRRYFALYPHARALAPKPCNRNRGGEGVGLSAGRARRDRRRIRAGPVGFRVRQGGEVVLGVGAGAATGGNAVGIRRAGRPAGRGVHRAPRIQPASAAAIRAGRSGGHPAGRDGAAAAGHGVVQGAAGGLPGAVVPGDADGAVVAADPRLRSPG
ncbi:hypothetical protein G6F59_013406 [Rhizopus arrhizus]|nr:hypothetical protein G6F59_013406 [Rhizopus arrhizus]